MKKFKNVTFFLSVVIAGFNNLSAQVTQKNENIELRKFGIGLNLEQNISNYSYFIQPNSSQLIFTFNISDNFRMETDLGFQRVNYHDDDNDHTRKENQLSASVGGYGLVLKSPICFYYGMKLGYVHYLENAEYTTTSKTTGKGVKIGPVMGLDYFISSHFSIGTEFRLMYAAELRTSNQNVENNTTRDVRVLAP